MIKGYCNLIGVESQLTKSGSLRCYFSLMIISMQNIDCNLPEIMMIKEYCNLISWDCFRLCLVVITIGFVGLWLFKAYFKFKKNPSTLFFFFFFFFFFFEKQQFAVPSSLLFFFLFFLACMKAETYSCLVWSNVKYFPTVFILKNRENFSQLTILSSSLLLIVKASSFFPLWNI